MNLTLYRIILYVQDVGRLAEFYRDILGLSVVEEIPAECVVLKAGHCELALHRVGTAFRDAGPVSSSANSNAKFVLATDRELTALKAELVAKGVQMGESKSFAGLTGPLCDGRDPEGNVFQLAQMAAS